MIKKALLFLMYASLIIRNVTSFKFKVNQSFRCFTMAAVKSLTPQQLKGILTSEIRSQYQIVDVRELNELKGNVHFYHADNFLQI